MKTAVVYLFVLCFMITNAYAASIGDSKSDNEFIHPGNCGHAKPQNISCDAISPGIDIQQFMKKNYPGYELLEIDIWRGEYTYGERNRFLAVRGRIDIRLNVLDDCEIAEHKLQDYMCWLMIPPGHHKTELSDYTYVFHSDPHTDFIFRVNNVSIRASHRFNLPITNRTVYDKSFELSKQLKDLVVETSVSGRDIQHIIDDKSRTWHEGINNNHHYVILKSNPIFYLNLPSDEDYKDFHFQLELENQQGLGRVWLERDRLFLQLDFYTPEEIGREVKAFLHIANNMGYTMKIPMTIEVIDK